VSIFGKVSLVTFGLLLFWTSFVVGGVESLSDGDIVGGLIGVGIFVAAMVALTKERCRANLRRATNTRGHPARVFVAFALASLVFTLVTVSLAKHPSAFVNVHVTRSLIDVGVAAGISLAALLTNVVVYIFFGRAEREGMK